MIQCTKYLCRTFPVVLITSIVLASGCYKEQFNELPGYSATNLEGTVPLDTGVMSLLEGVYALSDGDDRFGSQLVAKWADGYLCFYGAHDGRFINMQAGFRNEDSSIRMAGFWHDPLLGQQGEVQFTLQKEDGVGALFNRQNEGLLLKGYLNGDAATAIRLVYTRGFSEAVLSRQFAIGAHRGGGRNSDKVPYAENSLDLVKHAARFGANGVEIDIRLTRDNVPIVYHDADINPRLTLKSPVLGSINKLNAGFLRAYIRLVDGQVIPTLDEMLTTIIDSTELDHVWLDCKDGGAEGFFEYVLPVFRKARGYAQSRGRSIAILIGLPSEDAYDRFRALPDHRDLPSLCELTLAKTKEAGGNVFAPRWTLGILEAETEDAHANGIRVMTWTLDDPDGMQEVIERSGYDGILTNYPSMLAYHFYSQQ